VFDSKHDQGLFIVATLSRQVPHHGAHLVLEELSPEVKQSGFEPDNTSTYVAGYPELFLHCLLHIRDAVLQYEEKLPLIMDLE
jgi:hypothetical protein